VAWHGRMPAHLVRFALGLHVLAACEPELLEAVLAAAA